MTIAQIISKAADAGIELDANDFVEIDGEATIDGMPADQWLDAMTME